MSAGKLSKKMSHVLQACFDGENIQKLPKSSVKALISRGLLEENGFLTQEGHYFILSKKSIKKQCELLRLPFEEIKLQYQTKPEIAAYNHFTHNGYIGSYCEGGLILTVIKAMCLDVLEKLNTFNSREDACQRYLEAQFTIHENNLAPIFEAIDKISKEKYLNNFQEIISNAFVQEAYPGLSSNLADRFFNLVGRDSIKKVAKKISENPYQYRNGWPDLTLMSKSEVKFIEIKTNDKLHRNQFIIIQSMRPLLPGIFSVLKVTKITDKYY